MSPCLVVCDIVPNSLAHKERLSLIGSILKKINDKEVKTLDDFRKNIKDSKDIIKLETEENYFVALPVEKVLVSEQFSSKENGYQVTNGIRQLFENLNN